MAAPIGKPLTFCKLSSLHRVFGGIGSVRSSSNMRNFYKDRTPKQRHRSDPARIDEQPGPWKNYTNFEAWRKRPRSNQPFDPQRVTKLLEEMNFETENDMPVDMPDPYVEKPKRCLLCQHNIELSYKNTQLLSQFVSPYTGRIYGRHITGLCIHMQRQVAKEIRCARRFGFMPNTYKNPKYMKDPMLFNPFQKKTYPLGQ
ncbi:uncharacterized protein LOC123547540 [Mercenaria mercenaria]|uniref:uncharacterized protein LOC123547540 n=1 Tax=Mercenaria mercenaria TaxID=6596 RepID=UPI001E1D9423|nr:uncharacterized protein LOC123547540 [Mercenaria mercenaria]